LNLILDGPALDRGWIERHLGAFRLVLGLFDELLARHLREYSLGRGGPPGTIMRKHDLPVVDLDADPSALVVSKVHPAAHLLADRRYYIFPVTCTGQRSNVAGGFGEQGCDWLLKGQRLAEFGVGGREQSDGGGKRC